MAKAEGRKPKAKPTGKKTAAAKCERSQAERFIETARMIEADDTGRLFEDAFKKIFQTKES